MVYIIENLDLQVAITPDAGRWSIAGREKFSPSLKDLQFSLGYRLGRERRRILDRWPGFTLTGPETVESPVGLLRLVTISIGADRDDLLCTLVFAFPQARQTLIWKLEIQNQSPEPLFIDRIELLSAGFEQRHRSGSPGSIDLLPVAKQGEPDFAFFSNGWQSWSYAGVYAARDRYRSTRLGLLTINKDYNPGTPRPNRAGAFGSDMFGLLGERNQRAAILAGFLSQKEHFGSVETWIGGGPAALRLWANGDGARLDPGKKMTTDWACLQFLHLDDFDPSGSYFDLVARFHGMDGSSPLSQPPVGWCSWYYFSSSDFKGDLREADIRQNLESLRRFRPELPVEIVQIDDGFESQVGDWFSFNAGFPNGVKPLAREIREAGFMPGLWLAPFIVHPKSRLVADHPDWILRNEQRRPVNAGFLWGTFTSALDLTNPGALNYTTEVVHTAVTEWGFPYLKLDFLYAGALAGQHADLTCTRAQILRASLGAVRTAAGDETILLGCGCPLGSAIGLVDAMRIGADTSQRWRPAYNGIEFLIEREPALPAARNAIHNALTRAGMHRRWWINDPDCLLLRPETKLTIAEVQTIASVIALTGGSLLLSDHMQDLPPDRVRIAESLLPLIGRRPLIPDWFACRTPQKVRLDLDGPTGPWKLLALFNWEDQSKDLSLCLSDFKVGWLGDCFAREYWTGVTHLITPEKPGGSNPVLHRVPPHGTALFAVRQALPDRPLYLGSDLHVSQGLEAVEWAPGKDELCFALQRPGRASGRFELALPRPISEAGYGSTPLSWSDLGDKRYLFEIEFNVNAGVEVRYG